MVSPAAPSPASSSAASSSSSSAFSLPSSAAFLPQHRAAGHVRAEEGGECVTRNTGRGVDVPGRHRRAAQKHRCRRGMQAPPGSQRLGGVAGTRELGGRGGSRKGRTIVVEEGKRGSGSALVGRSGSEAPPWDVDLGHALGLGQEGHPRLLLLRGALGGLAHLHCCGHSALALFHHFPSSSSSLALRGGVGGARNLQSRSDEEKGGLVWWRCGAWRHHHAQVCPLRWGERRGSCFFCCLRPLLLVGSPFCLGQTTHNTPPTCAKGKFTFLFFSSSSPSLLHVRETRPHHCRHPHHALT